MSIDSGHRARCVCAFQRGGSSATASRLREKESSEGMAFKAVTLRELVDSPLICGEHFRTIELTGQGDAAGVSPSHERKPERDRDRRQTDRGTIASSWRKRWRFSAARISRRIISSSFAATVAEQWTGASGVELQRGWRARVDRRQKAQELAGLSAPARVRSLVVRQVSPPGAAW